VPDERACAVRPLMSATVNPLDERLRYIAPRSSFTTLLGHLATLSRNHLRVAGHDEAGLDLLSIPTQRRAFELLSVAIPLALK
jgi:hypothetical protein